MIEDSVHLDLAALDELKSIMEDDFSLLVDTFVNDSLYRIETITEAINAGDPQAVWRACHSFKGSAANMAAPALAVLCRQLEDLGRSESLSGARHLLEQLTAEYQQVSRRLAEL